MVRENLPGDLRGMFRALAIVFLLFAAEPAFAADAQPAAVPMDIAALQAKAEAGVPAFQAYLGFVYLNGQGGVPKDFEKAFGWYHKAADQGYVQAEYNLGVMYDEGIGVEQSHEAGYFWLTLAAATSGKRDYADRRDLAGTTLTLAQTDELKKRAANWKPAMPGAKPAATPAAGAALTPGTPVPWFRLPPPVQHTMTDNVATGFMIGKIDRAVEDGVPVYRAQVNKTGSASSIIRVTEGGKLISVSKLGN
jgi:hypothetical protein